eukprot:m.176498 g.176498  ORF g.176498 m.176498 type:complete len:221 (+) comp14902_c0_seq1:879-1541(+)
MARRLCTSHGPTAWPWPVSLLVSLLSPIPPEQSATAGSTLRALREVPLQTTGLSRKYTRSYNHARTHAPLSQRRTHARAHTTLCHRYTTTGDDGHPNQYAIYTTAECTPQTPAPTAVPTHYPTAVPTHHPTVAPTHVPTTQAPIVPPSAHTEGVSQGTLAGASVGCLLAGIVIGAPLVLVGSRRGALQMVAVSQPHGDFEPMLKAPPAHINNASRVYEDA